MAGLPNRLLAVEALVKIHSTDAFFGLVESLVGEPDKEIKGRALSALAAEYHSAAVMGEAEPRGEILQAFISNLGNETYVGSLQKTLGQISQEGLVNWLGLDFGDRVFEQERIAAGEGMEDVGAVKYASIWWEKNASKLRWNKESSHFEVTP